MPRIRARWLAAALVVVVAACSSPATAPAPPPAEPEAVDAAPDPDPEPAPEPAEPAPAGAAPLTGLPLDEDGVATLAERPVLIVKVENTPQAVPQAGLDAADVVVEELVEGGVTRFMALFHSRLPDAVGPVRSARPVDVPFGSGFGAPVFAYSGARPEVQGLLRASSMVALEEGAAGFARVPDRRAPHDLFVTPEAVLAAGLERGASGLGEAGLVFDADVPGGAASCGDGADADGSSDGDAEPSADDADGCAPPGAALEVTMSRQATTGWTYDGGAGVYRRDQDGEPSAVTGEGRIGAANVVVLATRHYSSGCCDTAGSPYVDTEIVGEGEGLVLRDGERFAASWRKAAPDAPLELLDADGEPFPLKPGPTWMLLPSSLPS